MICNIIKLTNTSVTSVTSDNNIQTNVYLTSVDGMSNNVNNRLTNVNDINNTFSENMSETDVLINRLNMTDEMSKNAFIKPIIKEKYFDCDSTEEIDETDVIKKDSIETKKLKIKHMKFEKEKKKHEKKIHKVLLKEQKQKEKAILKAILKSQLKSQSNSTKSNSTNSTDTKLTNTKSTNTKSTNIEFNTNNHIHMPTVQINVLDEIIEIDQSEIIVIDQVRKRGRPKKCHKIIQTI
jgi:hypothetical protein